MPYAAVELVKNAETNRKPTGVMCNPAYSSGLAQGLFQICRATIPGGNGGGGVHYEHVVEIILYVSYN